MTTITEILAEAFNRVKVDHGVNLSGVEFEHYSGTLSGVTFKAVGNVYSYPAFPPQVPMAPVAGFWPGATAVTCTVSHGDNHTPSRPVHTVDPNDCTHIGSVGIYYDCYWKFEAGILYLWDGSGMWNAYEVGESAQIIVDSQLRAVVNPS